MMENDIDRYVEIRDWEGRGFSPLVIFGNWLVAKMNMEERFELNHLSVLERHPSTDEVFILWQGRAVLIIRTDQCVKTMEMEKGVFYNVKKDTWHQVMGSKDASWIIVETYDPGSKPTEFYQLLDEEISEIRGSLPEWLAGN